MTLPLLMLALVVGAQAPPREVPWGALQARPPAHGAEALEVIDLLHLAPLLEKMKALRDAGEPPSASLQSEAVTRVLAASLTADQVMAAIDDERLQIGELRLWAQARQDEHVKALNLAIGVFSVGTAVGTGLTIADKTAKAGNIVGTAAGVLGAVLSFLALRSPAQLRAPFGVSSRMLAPFFGEPAAPESYPPLVWRYLTRAPPGATRTRLDELLAKWSRAGLVKMPADTEAARTKIAQLTGAISPSAQVSLEVLGHRLLMLSDVHVQVESLKVELSRALAFFRERSPDLP
jgi:hypothetical protein